MSENTYKEPEPVEPEKKEKLLKDISERTGREILKIKINRINFKKKRAFLDIYFKD